MYLTGWREKKRIRMGFYTLEDVRKRWPIFEGRIRVTTRMTLEECPDDLKRVMELRDEGGFIRGSALRDLWGQRSEEEGSSCDGIDVPSVPQTIEIPFEEDPIPENQVRPKFNNKTSYEDNENNSIKYGRSCNKSKGISHSVSQISVERPKDLRAVVARIKNRQQETGKYKETKRLKLLKVLDLKRKRYKTDCCSEREKRRYDKGQREERVNQQTRESNRPVTSRASSDSLPLPATSGVCNRMQA